MPPQISVRGPLTNGEYYKGRTYSAAYPFRVRLSRAFNKYKNIEDMMAEPKGVREHKEKNDEDHCAKLPAGSSWFTPLDANNQRISVPKQIHGIGVFIDSI
jgi:hypothetical protein